MISIIMSAYNASKTIKRAINSCLKQTYKDIEVVVVDDCSTDNTAEVVNKLVQKDARVKYYKNEENLGAGWTRNIGVHKMQGDYSIFLDSDDYLERTCIEKLYKAAIKHDADLISSGFKVVTDNKVVAIRRLYEETVLTGMDKYKSFKDRLNIFMHGCLMKRCLWDKVEYCKERFIEDTPTMVQLIWFANKRVYIPYAGYNYTQNSTSLIHTSSAFKEWIYRCLCTISNIEFFKDKEEKMFTIDVLAIVIKEIERIKINKEEYAFYINRLQYIVDYYNNNRNGKNTET